MNIKSRRAGGNAEEVFLNTKWHPERKLNQSGHPISFVGVVRVVTVGDGAAGKETDGFFALGVAPKESTGGGRVSGPTSPCWGGYVPTS